MLLQSSITNEYPWLISLLQNYPSLTWEELPSFLNAEGLNYASQELFSIQLENIKTIASKEWRDAKEEPIAAEKGLTLTCELCGQSACFVLFPIINTHNGKKLNIGSQCAKEFGITGADQMKAREKSIRALLRYDDLMKRFPRIEHFLLESPRTVKAVYKLPEDLQKQTLEAFNSVKLIANQYRETEDEPQRARLLQTLNEQAAIYDSLCAQIDAYEAQQAKDITAIRIKDLESLRALHKNPSKVLAALKGKTTVEPATMQYFIHEDFLRRYVLDRIASPLKQMDIEIHNVKDRWLTGTLRSSGLHVELDAQAFLVSYAVYVSNSCEIPCSHKEKVRAMLRASASAHLLLSRAKKANAWWLDFCAICDSSGEVILSTGRQCCMLNSQKLIEHCSALLLYPTEEGTGSLQDLMNNPVQRFRSLSEAKELINERREEYIKQFNKAQDPDRKNRFVNDLTFTVL